MNGLDTLETLPDGAIPNLKAQGPASLDGGKITTDGSGHLTAAGLCLTSLPITDPRKAGTLWLNSGVLTISAG